MSRKPIDMYRIDRFSIEQLKQLNTSIREYSTSIAGLPKNAEEALQKKGWLVPFLLAYDDLLWGRWSYWLEILQAGTIEGSGPIPKMEWAEIGSGPVKETNKMLTRCLDHHESSIDKFADWLLFGHGALEEPPQISSVLNEHYYRNFDLFLLLDNPTDYLSNVLCQETGKGYKGGLGYYPTPPSITQLMVSLTVREDLEQMKRQTVHDPCVGCGALLIPMSNYSLRGYAQDISGIAVKLCKIQMLWFAPWYAISGVNLGGFEELPLQRVEEPELYFV